MKLKIIALFLTLAISLVALNSYNLYASRQETSISTKESFAANRFTHSKVLDSNNINQSKNKIREKKNKNFTVLTESSNYLAYLPDENNKSAFNKISVAKENLYGLSFEEWIQANTADDFAKKLLDSKEIEVANRKAIHHRYISELHKKNKVSVIYIDFDDSLMSIGIHGDIDQSFEELEIELERFANEL